MILGIGNDIIEISRIAKAIENNRFKERVFTSGEIDFIDGKGSKAASYAGRFAAKEAISKAFGTGIRGFEMRDIEILDDDMGKPYVLLKNDLASKYDNISIDITISHCREYAVATAIIQENIKK